MSSRPPSTAIPANRQLPQKEVTLFKQILRHFEHKQYKKGLKLAETILKKHASHGETLAMKGLFLNSLDRKEEAYEFVKLGLRNDLKSHICWHVYGLLYRSDKNYEEASKCYTHALKYDKDNLQILRDYSLLQIQMRNYEAFNESRYQLLSLRSNIRQHWITFSISYFLLGHYDKALEVLNTYEETAEDEFRSRSSNTRKDGKRDFEWSQMMLYKAMVMKQMGDLNGTLDFLNTVGKHICDSSAVLEISAEILLALDRKSEAQTLYSRLIQLNPDNHAYLNSYLHSLSIFPTTSPSPLVPSEISRFLSAIERLSALYPRSNFVKFLPLIVLPIGKHRYIAPGEDSNDGTAEKEGDVFKERVTAYLRQNLRKGVPSLFVSMKSVYQSDPAKAEVIQVIVLEFLDNLRKHSKFDNNKSDEAEPPTAYLWTLYFLAQHYDFLDDYEKSLLYINLAIKHTPTLPELYMMKGRIYKHAGDLKSAANYLDQARNLDLQDRFINTKCVKYFIRNDQLETAEEYASLFTRAENPNVLHDLTDMQCSWYSIETGQSYFRQNQIGRALKRLLHVEKFFFDMTDDQFDFHTYSIRKMTLRSYLEMLKMEDRLRSHPFYYNAAKTVIECYLRLFDNPQETKQAQDTLNTENLSPAELKKLRNKQRKAELKAALQSNSKEDKENKKDGTKDKKDGMKKYDDPNGEKLLNTPDPLGDAMKYLNWLIDLSPGRADTWILAVKVYSRMQKPLLVLRALKRAHAIDRNNPEVHVETLRFLLSVQILDKIHPILQRVLNDEVPELFGEFVNNPIGYNDRFMKEVKDHVECLMAAAKSLVILDSSKTSEAVNYILNATQKLDAVKGLKPQSAMKIYKQLLVDFNDSEGAERFRKQVKAWFPLCEILNPNCN